VVAQDTHALNGIAKQLSEQANEKFRARAEQYQQEESDLSLRVAQQDSSQRIELRTKLNTVALDAAQRASIEAQLAALDKKEAAQLAAMHAEHAQELAAYQKQLGQQTTAAIAKQQAAIQVQTSAKLNARRNQVGSELRSLGGAPAPTVSLPPDVQAKLGQIHQEYARRFQADAQQAVEEYDRTRTDLDQQFQALHGQDVGATGAAAKQVRDLQKRYDDLQAQIQAQIQREADRLAKKMGFTTVLDNVTAANGGYDLTNDLIHDIESQHE
jgi:Skp family chaperone for outer membrane proteins